MSDVAVAAPASSSASFAPVSRSERISSIDVLRGAALLGIALMNIVFSGLPMAAGFNPNVAGGATGLNLWAFFLQYVLFDGKMRGIFSLMFGAGSYYMIARGVTRGTGVASVETYYRRTLWLMLFGMLHAFLIWHGDILYPYALLGLVLFPMQSARPKGLLIAAGVIIALMTAGQVMMGVDIQKTHKLALDAEQLERDKKPLSEEQKKAKKDWEEQRKYFNPTAEDLKKDAEMYSGSYLNLLQKRAAVVKEWHSAPFYMSGWDMLMMMLVGIAFAKLGILSASRSNAFYWKMLAWGYGFGIPVAAVSVWLAYKQNFEPLQTIFTFSTYQVARAATTLGHVAAMILLCKSSLFAGLRRALAAVGQTAFSNYILHSVIYGLVFYGYGLNLYGKLQRYQLYYVVLGMWIFSLIWSPLWLARYQFGPLEWCWRSLTYWKRQPMGIAQEESVDVAESPSSEPLVQAPAESA
jgi:uncharacterized protein